MTFTEEQKTKISNWAADGAGLSEIQSRLADEFGAHLSYMEVRFLVLELGATIKDKVVEQNDKPAAAPQKASAADDDVDADDVEFIDNGADAGGADGAAAANGVSVEINPITRPGFAMTGTVVFSDGVKADWGFTNDGRFALDAGDPAYKPSREDLSDFQMKLRDLMSKRGY